MRSSFRAVQPADYVAAAETLPWVLDAGTAFRWTGSWLTVFTTADPRGNAPATETNQIALVELLNRRKLAGYESYAPPPIFVSLDLIITVCAATGWLASDVESRGSRAPRQRQTPQRHRRILLRRRFYLWNTALPERTRRSIIQPVAGVNGVLDIEYRAAAQATSSSLSRMFFRSVRVRSRIENDPDYPERGTLRVIPEGGR